MLLKCWEPFDEVSLNLPPLMWLNSYLRTVWNSISSHHLSRLVECRSQRRLSVYFRSSNGKRLRPNNDGNTRTFPKSFQEKSAVLKKLFYFPEIVLSFVRFLTSDLVLNWSQKFSQVFFEKVCRNIHNFI